MNTKLLLIDKLRFFVAVLKLWVTTFLKGCQSLPGLSYYLRFVVVSNILGSKVLKLFWKGRDTKKFQNICNTQMFCDTRFEKHWSNLSYDSQAISPIISKLKNKNKNLFKGNMIDQKSCYNREQGWTKLKRFFYLKVLFQIRDSCDIDFWYLTNKLFLLLTRKMKHKNIFIY